MPKLTKEMLEKINNQYKEFKNLNPNELNKLFKKIYAGKDLEAKDEERYYFKLQEAFAIYLAKYNNAENKGTALSQIETNMTQEVGPYITQLDAILFVKDNLDKVDSIDELGKISTEDVELAKSIKDWNHKKIEEGRGKFFNDIGEEDLVYTFDAPEQSTAYVNRANMFVDAFAESIGNDYTNKVRFDKDFFDGCIYYTEKFENNVNFKSKNYLRNLNKRIDTIDTTNYGTKDKVEIERAKARTRFGTYFELSERSKKRTWGEAFKHPIDTFKEWSLKRNLASDIKSKYGFDTTALDKAKDELLNNNYRMPEDFITMTKKGDIVTETTDMNLCQDMAMTMYPKSKSLTITDIAQFNENLQEDIKDKEILKSEKVEEKNVELNKSLDDSCYMNDSMDLE